MVDKDGYTAVWGDANGAGEASAWDVTTPAGQSHIPGSENAYSKASGKVSGTQEVYTIDDYAYGDAYIGSWAETYPRSSKVLYASGDLYTYAHAARKASTSDSSAKDVYSAVYLYNGDITSFGQQGGLKASQSANTGRHRHPIPLTVSTLEPIWSMMEMSGQVQNTIRRPMYMIGMAYQPQCLVRCLHPQQYESLALRSHSDAQ